MSGQGNRPEADMMKMLAEFRLPGLPDMEQPAAAPPPDLEALSGPAHAAPDGAQAGRAGPRDSAQPPAAPGRDFEALAGASGVAVEGAQAVPRRHTEILRQSMSEM